MYPRYVDIKSDEKKFGKKQKRRVKWDKIKRYFFLLTGDQKAKNLNAAKSFLSEAWIIRKLLRNFLVKKGNNQ